MSAVCTKKRVRWSRCETWRAYQTLAYMEWCQALALSEVRASWGRFGGRVTYHRHGVDHFRAAARIRWAREKARRKVAA